MSNNVIKINNMKIRRNYDISVEMYIMVNITLDKGKPVKRQGRKATGLKHYVMAAGLPG